MNEYRVHYLYLTPTRTVRDGVTILAETDAQARQAFEAIYVGDDTQGRFYVIESVEALGLAEGLF